MLGLRAQVREGHPITLPETQSEPEPDLAIVQRRPQGYGDRHPLPSEVFWVIEFSDTSLAKDLEDKRTAYATSNIPEYWVVNLRRTEMVVHREPIGGDYLRVMILTTGDIAPVAFQDIAVSIDQILNR